MGRRSTGALTVEECQSVSISYLKKNNYLKRGARTGGTISFTNCNVPAGSISIIVNMEAGNESIRFIYLITSYTGKVEFINYTVPLIPVKSNLGRGYRWYFKCPVTSKLCTTLLKGDDTIFKSRAAHSALYYRSQIENPLFRNCKYFYYEKKLNDFKTRRRKFTYQGKLTRLQQRIMNLEDKIRNKTPDWLEWIQSL